MKRQVQVGGATVAYVDEGSGPPLLLLHGCPFSSYVWRLLIARLGGRFQCIAPDLLGLGDTETPGRRRLVVAGSGGHGDRVAGRARDRAGRRRGP